MLTVKTKGFERAQKRIGALRLSRKKRFWVHRQLGRQVRTFSRKRIRLQKDLDGVPFKKRADGKRAKMERGLSRKLVIYATAEQAKVTWANTKTAKIAYAQQYGIDEDFTASKAKRRYGTPDYKGPATRKQAKALREAGYTIARGRKGRKTPSLKWMTENLTLGQAGLVLRVLRDDAKKQRWKIKLAKRAFLGVNRKETRALSDLTSDLIVKYS